MTTESILTYLSTHSSFHDMEPSYLAKLAGFGKEVSYNDGEVFMRQDEKANRFYVLQRGKVSIEIPSITGEPVSLGTISEDEILGWSWLFPPYKWSFEARALEDVTAIEFDADAVHAACREDHRFGYDIVLRISGAMMERLKAARLQLLETYG